MELKAGTFWQIISGELEKNNKRKLNAKSEANITLSITYGLELERTGSLKSL